MIGAVIGDYIGSIYEWRNVKHTSFPLFNPSCRFTDDSVMSIAIADALLNKGDFSKEMRRYGRMFPCAGYGGRFSQWLFNERLEDYASYGNGSAMRAPAIGWYANSLDEALELAKQSALPTHSHPDGIRGAQVIAGCVWLLRNGSDKKKIKEWVTSQGYSLDFTIDQLRPTYTFDVSCKGSVPQAVQAFLEADDFESAIRLSISLGGDSDTIACMTGALAEACWGVPDSIVRHIVAALPEVLYKPLAAFEQKYAKPLPAYEPDLQLPPPLMPISVWSLENYWAKLSKRYSARHKTTFLPYDVFAYEMRPAQKHARRYTRHLSATFNLIPLIAYYAEDMLGGDHMRDSLWAGPVSVSFDTSPMASEPYYRYMITLQEFAFGESDCFHYRDYIRRRVNDLHEEPCTRKTNLQALVDLHEKEYELACLHGDIEQAWLIWGLNCILYCMQGAAN